MGVGEQGRAGWTSHQGLGRPPHSALGSPVTTAHHGHWAGPAGMGLARGPSAAASSLCFRPRGDGRALCSGVRGGLPSEASKATSPWTSFLTIPCEPHLRVGTHTPLLLCPWAQGCHAGAGEPGLGWVPAYLNQRCAQPEDAHGQQVLLQPHLHRLVTRLREEQASRGLRGRPSTRSPRGQAHRLPPGAGRVQPAALAELQAAGVGHARGVVDLEPVRVAGDPAAAELWEGWAGTVRGRGTYPRPGHAPRLHAPATPRLTSVWMMLQALVRPTLPGVPYRCRPFFRSCCAYLSICRTAGPPSGQLHPPRPDPRPPRPPAVTSSQKPPPGSGLCPKVSLGLPWCRARDPSQTRQLMYRWRWSGTETLGAVSAHTGYNPHGSVLPAESAQILVPKSTRSPIKEPGSLEKRPIPGLGRGTPKMGLECLLAPERREVL